MVGCKEHLADLYTTETGIAAPDSENYMGGIEFDYSSAGSAGWHSYHGSYHRVVDKTAAATAAVDLIVPATVATPSAGFVG